MRILIAGANGYLGSQLVFHLQNSHDLLGLTRQPIKPTKVGYDSSVISLTDDFWEQKVKHFNPNLVINTVACYGRNKEPLSQLIESNVLFPIKLCELIANTDSVFVHCGTSLPSQVNQYALTKNQFPPLAKTLFNRVNHKFIELKLEHFYGAFDKDDKFTSMVIRRCRENKELELTSGLQKRDFLYIEDLLSAFDTILDNLDKLEKNEVIEVGTGVAISIRRFVETVIKVTKSRSAVKWGAIKPRDNELMLSCANTSKLMKLGWSVKFSLENAIAEILSKESI